MSNAVNCFGPREMNQPEIAIIIPAWHERENLEHLLPSLQEVVTKLGLRAEVVVVDGGSNDGSRELTEALGVRFVEQQEKGYGNALMSGFTSTQARYIVTMDADLSHQPVFLADLWEHRNDAEVVIASRYVAGGRADMTVFRRILSRALNKSFGWILSLPVRDLSSGFRLYRREAILDLQPKARDFDILEEILVRIYLKGGRVREVPFSYMARGSGNSHARLFRFGIAFLRTLARMYKLRRSGNGKIASEFDFDATPPPAEPLPEARLNERPIAKVAGRSAT